MVCVCVRERENCVWGVANCLRNGKCAGQLGEGDAHSSACFTSPAESEPSIGVATGAARLPST